MTICAQCGLEVAWIPIERDPHGGKKLRKIRWLCRNPDGSDHWDLCSKTRFERIKREGEAFERHAPGKIESGYRSKAHGEKLVAIDTVSERGADYKPFAHLPGCLKPPPWEACSCPGIIK